MMNNAVIAIYLVKLFAAVLGVMGVGCILERSVYALKAANIWGRR